jgi:hypothetical protein
MSASRSTSTAARAVLARCAESAGGIDASMRPQRAGPWEIAEGRQGWVAAQFFHNATCG